MPSKGGAGGAINLAAAGSVVLESGAALTVAGTYTDAAGKGGKVFLAAGSSTNGVAPSVVDTRDATTGAFLGVTTPVVDIQTGSRVDLSVATNSVALAAGRPYALPRATVPGDVLVAEVGGVITQADGSTVSFGPGVLPVLTQGSSLTLNAAGKLTYLANAATGTFTGTLHLRAPQTTPGPALGLNPALPPDVQINPINGSILNPSSIVVEGYQTYHPVAGYVDSVEVDIDTNGRSFASAANTATVLQSLTQNWGTGSGQVNGSLSSIAGAQLHLQPGAEIVGSSATPTVNTVTYTAPGSTSTLAVPVGATVVLPSTTNILTGASTNTLVFSAAVTLTGADNGVYTNTVNSIGASATTTTLPVLADTSIKVGSAVAAGALTATVGGTITPMSGAPVTFSAGVLPALPASSTITFVAAGALSSATTASATGLSLAVQNSFHAGVPITLPANSTVVVSTNGGAVTFAKAGTLTWSSRQVAGNAFAVQLPTDGSQFTTGSGGTLLATSGGSGALLTLNKSTAVTSTTGGSALTLAAGGSLFLPEGTFTTANNSTTTANSLQIGSSTTGSTAAFTVTVKSAQGGTITFPNTVTGSITTLKGGTQKLAKTTLDTSGVQLDAGGKITFGSSGADISSTVAGIITLPLSSLDTTGITIPGTGGTIVLPATTSLTAGALVATSGGTITTPTGLVQTFAAGNIALPIAGGSVITLAGGNLALTSTTASSIAVTVTNNLAAGSPTTIAANSVVNFTAGATVVTTSGSVGGVTIVNNLLGGKVTPVSRNDVIQLASAADVATVVSTSAFNLASNGPITLGLAGTNPTGSKVAFLAGTSGTGGGILAAVESGSYTTSGATGLGTPVAGDLKLASAWDLSTYRYGPNVDPAKPGSGEPGILTVRTPGNLILGYTGYNTTTKVLEAGSLSDGFGPAPSAANNGIWQAPLLTAGAQSWSYNLVAGSDLAAANGAQVLPGSLLGTGAGSLLFGQGSPVLSTATGNSVTRASIVPKYYQTIRTGTGDIAIAAGRDVQLLNPLATIYTAGTAAAPLANFDVPVLNSSLGDSSSSQFPYYGAQYSVAGGNLIISAQNDIARYVQNGTALVADSTKELPSNWLYRRGNVGPDGNFAALTGTVIPTTEIQSTSWWVDFSNFFSDVGALGGGNVALKSGRNISNVSAAVPTNARMPGYDATGKAIAPAAGTLTELGGGNLVLQAGGNIDGGVYYVERGDASLNAGGSIVTNATRTAFTSVTSVNAANWLPTTFFLGKGNVAVNAGGDILLGQVANPFWLPSGAGNRAYEKTYFTTFDPADTVNVASLDGTVTLQGRPDTADISSVGSAAWLLAWYSSALSSDAKAAAAAQPWLRLAGKPSSAISAITPFETAAAILPGTVKATAFSGDIDLRGTLTLAPSPTGSIDLLAAGNINGLGVNGVNGTSSTFGSAVINLSDASPGRLPGPTTPVSFSSYTPVPTTDELSSVNVLFAESGTTTLSLQQKTALHGQVTDPTGQLVPLHYNDTNPVHLYAKGGDLSGLTLYSAKPAQVVAGGDITDIALYVQNIRPGDTTVVAAGQDLVAYDPSSPLRLAALSAGNTLPGAVGDTGPGSGTPTTGDIQIAGPGTLQIIAGRNLDLGSGSNSNRDGTAAGVTSVGSVRNPGLPKSSGASIIMAAGVNDIYTPSAAALGLSPGLATTSMQFSTFIAQFLDPATAGAEATRYLPVLGTLMGETSTDPVTIWSDFGYQSGQPLSEHQASLALGIFNRVLRDAARDRNDPTSPKFGTYTDGFDAIAALLPGSPQPTEDDLNSTSPVVRPAGPWNGRISLSTREVKTIEGGDVSLLVPGGAITVGRATDPQKPDQGILTERGGAISLFAADSVNVGTSRIFTLRGGNEVIWSTWGNIAAGSGSKTVFSAPPTRVLVDPQSGDVENDLAGLATGSGIGVLATTSGVKPGDVDLIAPVGTIDAGDAGIRSSGNLNLAARVVLNASNIQVGGASTGTPPPPPAPNLGSLTAASSASASASSAATEVASRGQESTQMTEIPSLISVEVLGYGGGDGSDDDDEKKKAATGSAGGTSF